ncbi:MAG: tRNA pseudouridine(55) synthase TruB [Geminicoccaceae bacterium]
MSRRKQHGRPINGWMVIDKAEGMTSTDVVTRVKRLTQAQKVGHGGTLDPLASGVLPIAMGEATKTVPYIMDAAKSYLFTIRFGEARDTDDAAGTVTAESAERPTDAAILAELPAFLGHIQQRPPTYAAVKINGERAYDLARRGETVELASREVRIDELELLGRPDADHASFRMVCGKGAYVRAVARDLGLKLGCFAHVTALRRTSVGAFDVADAISLETLAGVVENETLPQVLVSVATALVGIPALAVTEPQALRLRAGQSIRVPPQLLGADDTAALTVRAMRSGDLIALAHFESGELSPVRVFHL